MTEVLLFHHAQGLTPGVRAFDDNLRGGGHIVHTPDLFDGRIFPNIEEGLAYIEEIGFDNLRERGVRTVDDLPFELVYAGFSLGVLPAQPAAAVLDQVLDFAFIVPLTRAAESWRMEPTALGQSTVGECRQRALQEGLRGLWSRHSSPNPP